MQIIILIRGYGEQGHTSNSLLTAVSRQERKQTYGLDKTDLLCFVIDCLVIAFWPVYEN